MLARVADHELIAPPSRVMTDAGALIEWAKGVDYADADGVIVSLDAAAGDPPRPERPDLVKWIRARRPSIAIYAWASAASERSIQTALNLFADFGRGRVAIESVRRERRAKVEGQSRDWTECRSRDDDPALAHAQSQVRI